MSTYYLMHHGIKGQKWGIRRFQNEDGSLTKRGIQRQKDIYDLKPRRDRGGFAKNSVQNFAMIANSSLGSRFIDGILKSRKSNLSSRTIADGASLINSLLAIHGNKKVKQLSRYYWY